MEQLYSSGNHTRALGASFGLENMAITMWDHLIPGLEKLRRDRVPAMDLTYFTFHRELESTHEEAMAKAVRAIDTAPGLASGGLSPAESDDFSQRDDHGIGLPRRILEGVGSRRGADL